MKTDNQVLKGVTLALLASIVSGIAIFYSKISVAKIDPLVLTSSRNFYVGLVFLTLLLLTGKFNQLKSLNRKNIITLVGISFIGGFIPFYLFFTGLKLIPAQTANLIQKSLFIWVSLMGIYFLKEKPKPIYLVSYLLVILGTYYFIPFKLNFSSGELMVFVATLLWSVENILAKKVLKNVSPSLVGLFRMFGGSLFLLTTVFITGKGKLLLALNPNQLTVILIGGSILFFYVYFWFRALKYAPAGLVTLMLTFSVVVGNILNGVFANVKILPREIHSLIFVGIAIILVACRLLYQPEINRSG